ncbi:MAG: hypothetical protein VX737_03785 [Pseudomonadota bacterium]|nr:hypothetical protein [Pseudomonadota bacterium]
MSYDLITAVGRIAVATTKLLLYDTDPYGTRTQPLGLTLYDAASSLSQMVSGVSNYSRGRTRTSSTDPAPKPDATPPHNLKKIPSEEAGDSLEEAAKVAKEEAKALVDSTKNELEAELKKVEEIDLEHEKNIDLLQSSHDVLKKRINDLKTVMAGESSVDTAVTELKKEAESKLDEIKLNLEQQKKLNSTTAQLLTDTLSEKVAEADPKNLSSMTAEKLTKVKDSLSSTLDNARRHVDDSLVRKASEALSSIDAELKSRAEMAEMAEMAKEDLSRSVAEAELHEEVEDPPFSETSTAVAPVAPVAKTSKPVLETILEGDEDEEELDAGPDHDEASGAIITPAEESTEERRATIHAADGPDLPNLEGQCRRYMVMHQEIRKTDEVEEMLADPNAYTDKNIQFIKDIMRESKTEDNHSELKGFATKNESLLRSETSEFRKQLQENKNLRENLTQAIIADLAHTGAEYQVDSSIPYRSGKQQAPKWVKKRTQEVHDQYGIKRFTGKGAGGGLEKGKQSWSEFLNLEGKHKSGISFSINTDGSISISPQSPNMLARSIIASIMAQGKLGKPVNIDLKAKDPYQLQDEISALIDQADKQGIPLDQITISTSNFNSGTNNKKEFTKCTLAEMVERRAQGEPSGFIDEYNRDATKRGYQFSSNGIISKKKCQEILKKGGTLRTNGHPYRNQENGALYLSKQKQAARTTALKEEEAEPIESIKFDSQKDIKKWISVDNKGKVTPTAEFQKLSSDEKTYVAMQLRGYAKEKLKDDLSKAAKQYKNTTDSNKIIKTRGQKIADLIGEYKKTTAQINETESQLNSLADPGGTDAKQKAAYDKQKAAIESKIQSLKTKQIGITEKIKKLQYERKIDIESVVNTDIIVDGNIQEPDQEKLLTQNVGAQISDAYVLEEEEAMLQDSSKEFIPSPVFRNLAEFVQKSDELDAEIADLITQYKNLQTSEPPVPNKDPQLEALKSQIETKQEGRKKTLTEYRQQTFTSGEPTYSNEKLYKHLDSQKEKENACLGPGLVALEQKSIADDDGIKNVHTLGDMNNPTLVVARQIDAIQELNAMRCFFDSDKKDPAGLQQAPDTWTETVIPSFSKLADLPDEERGTKVNQFEKAFTGTALKNMTSSLVDKAARAASTLAQENLDEASKTIDGHAKRAASAVDAATSKDPSVAPPAVDLDTPSASSSL